jgi:predicted RecA/RadA family phage recombinase
VAGNRTRAEGRQLSLPITDGGVASGDPCLVGQLPGVAIAAAVAGVAVVDLKGVYALSVKGVTTAAAASAVVAGDILYYVAANTPKLSKAVGDALAVRFGYALAGVNASAVATIEVKLGY